MTTIDLYNTKDTTRIRELLFNEQQGLDLLTGLPLDKSKWVLDHKHDDEQFVRGVLHRQSNASLGKLEGIWTRYLSYWYPYDLPTFLRQSADYIEKFDKEPDTRYRHPNWQKKVRTLFNSLNASQMKEVLKHFNKPEGNNLAERKKLFSKIVLDKSNTYDTIRNVINQVKEK